MTCGSTIPGLSPSFGIEEYQFCTFPIGVTKTGRHANTSNVLEYTHIDTSVTRGTTSLSHIIFSSTGFMKRDHQEESGIAMGSSVVS